MEVLFSDAFAKKLETLATEKALQYKNAKPFPHIYIDNFLPEEAAEVALADFPEPKELEWIKFHESKQRKLAYNAIEKVPPGVREVMYFLNSRPILTFLEILTGIDDLIPDPYYSGAGLHQIQPGGNLEVHADFNKHPRFKLDRRINMLVYLNKEWKEEYGGHFELWNTEMTAAEEKILPVFNRCTIFSTTTTSYHGHPTPLACPPGRTRKSMATYYYSVGRPEDESYGQHGSIFKHRPGTVPRLTLKEAVRAVTPPILLTMAKGLGGKKSAPKK